MVPSLRRSLKCGSHWCSELRSRATLPEPWELAHTETTLCSLESAVPLVQAAAHTSEGQFWGQSSGSC